jgi:hypothetical protein
MDKAGVSVKRDVFAASGQIPSSHALVFTSRNELGAIGGKSQAAHKAAMADQRLKMCTGLTVPEPDGLVPTACGHAPSIGRKGDRVHEVDVPPKLVHQRPGGARQIADVGGITAGQSDLAAVGGKRHTEYPARSAGDGLANWLAGRGVPQPGEADRRVIVEPAAAARNRSAIGRIGKAEDVSARF